VGIPFINKKAPVRRLFEPEAFHTGYLQKIPTNVGVSFINKKAPVRRLVVI
jgi:hypothetical protein